jgi:hypothetical protein
MDFWAAEMVSCFLAAEILARSASCWSRRSRHCLKVGSRC